MSDKDIEQEIQDKGLTAPRITPATIVEETGAKKKDVTIEQTDIPVAKAELLELINGLCRETDVKEDQS